jgi:hypothetical protein
LNALCPILLKDLFLSLEAEEEDGSFLADALEAFDIQWPGRTFDSKTLAELLNRNDPEQQIASEKERVAVFREFLFPEQKMRQDITARAVGAALLKHIGEPVKVGDATLTLMAQTDRTNLKHYSIRKTGPSSASA